MSTDDAYVEADKVGVSTDVSGIVKEIDVTENQQVDTGQVLYRLDDLPFRYALDRAKAQVGIVRNELNALRRTIRTCRRRSSRRRTTSTITRPVPASAGSRRQGLRVAADLRHRSPQPAGRTTEARLAQAAAGAVVANLNGDPDTRSRSIRAIATRSRSATKPRASSTDRREGAVRRYRDQRAVDRARQVPRGVDHGVLSGPTDHVWVDANPKETELTYVRTGQQVAVSVDTYPDLEWHGTVESISPAAAQEFQLLPAQNTSGNWVKVVQRIPMRVRVDTSDQSRPPLRAGMSVEVDVDTGHARGLPHFLSGLFGRSEKGA